MENNLEQTEIDARIEQIIAEIFAKYDSVFRTLAHYDTIPIEEIPSYKNKELERSISKNFDQYGEFSKNLA